MSHYCHVHGEYSEYQDGCPDCQDAEVRAERRAAEDADRAQEAEWRADSDRREMLDRLAEAEHKRANPGQHQCPSCKYITLLRDASRCPMCHATVGDDYWQRVRSAEQATANAEKLRREKEAEEWKKGEPERLAAEARKHAAELAAETARLKAEAEKREAEAAKKQRSVMLTYLNLLWAVPVCSIAGAIVCVIIGGILGAFSSGSTFDHGARSGQTVGLWLGALAAVGIVAQWASCEKS